VIDLSSTASAHCTDASKMGAVEVEMPLPRAALWRLPGHAQQSGQRLLAAVSDFYAAYQDQAFKQLGVCTPLVCRI
jgi:hypothetical protein